tara:strand:- start:3847 stop:4119 length:273 start_codon:yes stop_codon:yes gene_type:complete
MYYAICDARDGSVWGAAKTMDEAWGNAKKELKDYITFMRHHNQDPEMSYDDLRMHFFINRCSEVVWENHVSSSFPLSQKITADGEIAEGV